MTKAMEAKMANENATNGNAPRMSLYDIKVGEEVKATYLWKETAGEGAKAIEGGVVARRQFEGTVRGVNQKVRVPNGKDEGGEAKFRIVPRTVNAVQEVKVDGKRALEGIAKVDGEPFVVRQTVSSEPWEVVRAADIAAK